MKNIWPTLDNIYWYNKPEIINHLQENIETDVIIIGGGTAGLSAAQAFAKKNKKVVLLEQYYCGSGASGKSSGFITPNSEISLTEFAQRYNLDVANQIWKFISSGVQDLRKNILDNNFICDYVEQDSLEVALKEKDLKELKTEYDNLIKLGYKTRFYDAQNLKKLINTDGYYGGVVYENTFGINAYLYCQELKKLLHTQGVLIYEETPVISIDKNICNTFNFQIKADYIIVCVDYLLEKLDLLPKEVYHAQNFLMISKALSDKQISEIFLDKFYMTWDTELIYNYFRLTGDKRLLIGGGSVLTTYSSNLYHDNRSFSNKLLIYLNKKFPKLDIQFEYQWPGFIGISKDIGPIAGPDKDKPYIYYISACAGLPIAAALGNYSAQCLLENRNDLDEFFCPYRKFPIDGFLQTILGTKISFALSNLIKKNVP